ncbi:MAG: hypothetical protein Q9165_006536 [Trypethelium subeluteriae]
MKHGEVFVLDDGGEVDLDLGNYERYLNITLTRENNITTGKIYQHVIQKERRGDYLGHTVQVVPHITDAIQDWIERVARIPVDDTNETPDVCIIELGGTVGDMESMPFIEGLVQLRRRAGKNNFLQIHVSYVPVIGGEQKTKPTQQNIKSVRSTGLLPDLIACRCEIPLSDASIDKVARFCQVEPSQVVGVRDMPSTYQVPMLLEQQGLTELLRDILHLDAAPLTPTTLTSIPISLYERGQQTWKRWKELSIGLERHFEPVNIVLVGKYTELHDSYLSVVKSLEHAAMRCHRKLELTWVDASHLERPTPSSTPTPSCAPSSTTTTTTTTSATIPNRSTSSASQRPHALSNGASPNPSQTITNHSRYHAAWHAVINAQGILIPGGFGVRGTAGMLAAAQWARENHKPYLGICLGMQIAVIEYARHVCGLEGATSAEFDDLATDPVVMYMPEIDKATMGGTMRLGLRPTRFQEGSEWSRLRRLYGGGEEVWERHRHRYEVNPEYIGRLQEAGMHFVGKDEKGERMEIVELKDHDWFVGVQFHPEYLSRVLQPSKPYLGFVAASAGVLGPVTRELELEVQGKNKTSGMNGDLVNGLGKLGLGDF